MVDARQPANNNTIVNRRVVKGQAYYSVTCRLCLNTSRRKGGRTGAKHRQPAEIEQGSLLWDFMDALPDVEAFVRENPLYDWAELAVALELDYRSLKRFLRGQGLLSPRGQRIDAVNLRLGECNSGGYSSLVDLTEKIEALRQSAHERRLDRKLDDPPIAHWSALYPLRSIMPRVARAINDNQVSWSPVADALGVNRTTLRNYLLAAGLEPSSRARRSFAGMLDSMGDTARQLREGV